MAPSRTATLPPVTAHVDHELADLATRVDVLRDVTPVNAEEAWEASVAAGHRAELALRYRSPETDVEGVTRELDRLPVDEVEDPVVRTLVIDKQRELRLQARLVAARGTPDFLARSHELYGTADDGLVALAEALLDRFGPSEHPPARLVTPAEFVGLAEAEIARYRRQDPSFPAEVSVRGDVPSLMVVQHELLVGSDSWIPDTRGHALIQHEVGTHLLTAGTGGRQPLRLLGQGLAGYEETQEALGVLAEHLVDGIDADRIRTLAARALAARRLSDGVGFADLFAELHDGHRFPAWAAWTIAMRVVRGGGLTKDVIYLRGIAALVEHLAGGGQLEPLLVGKFHLRQLPAIDDLLARGMLHPASLRPHWLDGPGPAERLAALRSGTEPHGSEPDPLRLLTVWR